jgi:DNA ligase (NAD+)
MGKIKDVLDLYSLTYNDLLGLDSFKDKKINNLLTAIKNTKHSTLSKVVNALGIEHIGEVASAQICEEFGLDILDISFDDLVSLDGIGEQMANSFLEFFKLNKALIEKLFFIIEPKVEKKIEAKQNPFKDKTVVLTGTMSTNRAVVKKQLELLGAKVSSSVSKKTNYLIFGEDAGSKYDKAISLGVEVLNEDEYNDKIKIQA